MIEWLDGLFLSPQWSITLLFASLLLGIVSAMGSCCNIAALGAIVSYSGAKENTSKKDLFVMTASFVIGIILASALIGLSIGIIGQAAGKYLQTSGKFVAGITSVFFGLIILDFFPFKIPTLSMPENIKRTGILSDIIFGFALGGVSLSLTLGCCSPMLPFIISMAAVSGSLLKSELVMLFFGLGFSIPLAIILLGFSIGKLAATAQKSMPLIKKGAGIILIVIGFYFLFTI